MANQIIQTQGSATGQLGESVKTGKAKGEAKGGLFATLITSFQKHIKQAETGLQIDGQKTSGKEKIAVNGLKTALLKVNSESVETAGKAKSLLKVADADKVFEGKNIKGKTLLTKPLLQASNVQVLAEKDGDTKNILSVEKLVIDGTEKQQKDTVIGLGVFQQESRQPAINKLGEQDVKQVLFAGSASKNNKTTEDAGKPPSLVMNVQDSAEKKAAPVAQAKTEVGQNKTEVGQNKTEKIVSEVLVAGKKSVETVPVKQDSQGRFVLKDMGAIDNGIDVSKLIKGDPLAGVKNQLKSDGVDIALKNQVKGEEASAKAVALASAASATDDVKVISQDDVNNRQMIDSNLAQTKQVKEGQFQQGLDAAENVSKVKSSFKAVAANRSGIAGVQAQASVSVASNVQPEVVMASASGQDTNMAGDDRGTGRSTAELLMTDGSVRDVRSTRSDFAIQMAYRSAASFKPSDAMLEISKAAKDGAIKLELMLEPATLGKIQVSLQADAQKQIQVHLIVDQQSSRQVLEQQLPQLRQALADQGLNLSGFTMDMNSQQQNDGKASHDVAGMGHMDANGESETGVSLGSSLRMGVNMADDGSLSILA